MPDINCRYLSQKGFIKPIVALFVLGIFATTVAVIAGNPNIKGIVLGTSSVEEVSIQDLSQDIYVSVVSPEASWNLTLYLCTDLSECTLTEDGGRWYSRISGAKTDTSGYEVAIPKPKDTGSYSYLKAVARQSGSNGKLLKPVGNNEAYIMIKLANFSDFNSKVVFK